MEINEIQSESIECECAAQIESGVKRSVLINIFQLCKIHSNEKERLTKNNVALQLQLQNK